MAETFDGILNDINGFHVTKEHAFTALDNARPGPVTEGNAGGGTAMICHEFKGGIGTASRVLGPARAAILSACCASVITGVGATSRSWASPSAANPRADAVL